MKIANALLVCAFFASGVIALSTGDSKPDLFARDTDIEKIAGPNRRQDAAIPPVCFNACLLESVTSSGTCEIFDTPCVCGSSTILAVTLDCLSKSCSQSEFPQAVQAGDALCAPYEGAIGPSVMTSVTGMETSLIMATSSEVCSVTHATTSPASPTITMDGRVPPCFGTCLASAASEAGNCQASDTPCICNDTPTLSSWLDCANTTCSSTDFPLAATELNTMCRFSGGDVESSSRSRVGLSMSATATVVPPTSTASFSAPSSTAPTSASATIVSSSAIASTTQSGTSGASRLGGWWSLAGWMAAVLACSILAL